MESPVFFLFLSASASGARGRYRNYCQRFGARVCCASALNSVPLELLLLVLVVPVELGQVELAAE